MNDTESLKQQVAKAVDDFVRVNMSMTPESVLVDIHSDCIVVTLHKAISRVEEAYTRQASSQILLDKFYKDVFEASKIVFETAIAEVFPRRIAGSFISLHPRTGKCIIVISVCKENEKQTQSN